MIHVAEVPLSHWFKQNHQRMLGVAPMKKTISYYCNTRPTFSKELWITSREGFSVMAESLNASFPTNPAIGYGLLVVVTYEVTGAVRRNFVEQFDEEFLKYARELAMIKTQMTENQELPLGSITSSRSGEYSLIYLVEEDRLKVDGGSIYVDQLDIVVSLERPKHWNQLHPFCLMGSTAEETLRMAQVAAETAGELQESDFIHTLTIVDNGDGEPIGPRYIDSGEGIIKIVPRRDECRSSGFYASYRNPSDRPASKAKLKLQYSKDGLDMPWFTLHGTAEEAIEYRRNDAQTQARLRMHELTLKQNDLEVRFETSKLALARSEQEKESLQRSIELERIKNDTAHANLAHEKEKFEISQQEMRQQLENNARKHRQEMAATRLKNQGEFLKSSTVIAQGLIGIALLILKFAK